MFYEIEKVMNMIIELPLFLNGKLEYNIISERTPCSDSCLLKKYKFTAFHLPGLGSKQSHLDYPLITENIIVKKRSNEIRVWNKLSYDYEINPNIQRKIFNDIQLKPIEGLIRIVDQCDCCYAMDLINGDLSYSSSFPVTKYYSENFSSISNWGFEKLMDFINQSSHILLNLHKINIIHGDVAAHNFIIDSNQKVTLIDIDNISVGSEDLISQEVTSYLLYTVLPIIRTFETKERVAKLFSRLLYEDINKKYGDRWPEKLITILKERHNEINISNPVVYSYLYELDMLNLSSSENYNLLHRVQQLQTEVLESNRVKAKAFEQQIESYCKQLEDAGEYAKSLDVNLAEASTYAKSLEINLKEASQYAKTLENSIDEKTSLIQSMDINLEEASVYAASLENEIKKMQEYIKTLEEKLKLDSGHCKNKIQGLELLVNEKEEIIKSLERSKKNKIFSFLKKNK